jgi:hypothetical protein
MLAVKRQLTTARTILEFGIDPTIFLLRDADGSTPLHAAVQKEDTAVLAELLLKYGPTELLYTENSVGQTPLDIASLKGIPRLTGPGYPVPSDLPVNPEQYLRTAKMAPPFHVEKQKREIPKMRATLDTLLAEGILAHGTKLTTELLAFADSHGGEARRRDRTRECRRERERGGRTGSPHASGSNARTYFALRDAAAARPGRRQLVHLADVQRSVRRNLEQKLDGMPLLNQLSRAIEDEDKEADPEEKRIAELKARSLFALGNPIFDPKQVDLYGEDKF